MISKERLEELIEQGATICNQYIDYNNNICYRFGKASIIQDNDEQHIELKLSETNTSVIMYDTKYLYETEEDARWELEMTATRTDTLKLANWEQFCYEENETRFTDKLDNRCSISYETELLGDNYIAVYQNHFTLFRESATKENYTKACELCIKLFKGEEV
ncbi:MAG: hypothetical protein J6T74_00555 [Clostridia bacterium]|nr:hypothetical protein [Clostridia bacterium]MBO7712059.1 hypothetical protein [Methanobrevibacter sp.]MBO7712132.1 hypothetical protein [Methanobrevibacter sp.]